jgi:ATPase subunit of ABC transporter with duplicated ATPase domains
MVSQDRYMINVFHRIVGCSRGQIVSCEGKYDEYLKTRVEVVKKSPPCA